jgi:Ca-activated chloride channel homolog
MSFLDPHYFWLLLALFFPLLQRERFALNTASIELMLSFVFLVIALARPVIEQEPVKNEQLLSDVVIAVDLSYSMQAEDIAPNRLAKAKELLRDLIKQNQKNRYAVLGFTTNAMILSPLTQDSELLLHLFDSLDATLISTKGSSVMPALQLARKISKSKNLRVVFLSDGGDEPSYEAEVHYAKQNNLRVNTLMLATAIGGTLKQKDGSLLTDESGAIVVSRENANIKTISDATGGVYSKDITTIADALESQREDDYKAQSVVYQNKELFYYFIALALGMFVLSMTRLKRFVKKVFVPLFLLFGITLEASVFEYYYEKNGKEAYHVQEYKRSVDLYEKIEKDRAYFNVGCAYYKLGEYEKALGAFARVRSSDPVLKAQVFYNQANTLVRLKEFEKAREAYLKSLTLMYTSQADENLAYIKDVAEQQSMITGQQKSEQKSEIAKKEQSSQKKKEGGGSNMQVKTDASSGAGEGGKKTKSETIFSQNASKTKLSSTQYELINKRGVNEKKPW